MSDTAAEFGRRGEDSAAAFLCGKGYEILERNARIGHLEIDIVARKDNTVAFCEVKTRSEYPGKTERMSRPCFAVDAAKQQKLITAAREYMKRHSDTLSGLCFCIDIVEVFLLPKSDKYKVLKISHLPDSVHLRGR